MLVDLEPVLLGTGTTPPESPGARAFGVERILLLPVNTRTYGAGLAALPSFQRSEAYPPTVVRLCQTLVDQAAVGIENALLFAQSVRHVRHLEALREVDTAITASPDLAQILQVLLTQATTICTPTRQNVLWVDSVTRALTLAASHEFGAPQITHSDLCLDGGFAQRTAAQRRSLHIPPKFRRPADHGIANVFDAVIGAAFTDARSMSASCGMGSRWPTSWPD